MSNSVKVRPRKNRLIAGICPAVFGAQSVARVIVEIPYEKSDGTGAISEATFRVRPGTQGQAKKAIAAGVWPKPKGLDDIMAEHGVDEHGALRIMTDQGELWLSQYLVYDDGQPPWDDGFVMVDGTPIGWPSDEVSRKSVLRACGGMIDLIGQLMIGSQQAVRKMIEIDEKNSENGSDLDQGLPTKARSSSSRESATLSVDLPS